MASSTKIITSMRCPVSNPLRVVFMVRNTRPFFDVLSWKVHRALIKAKLEPYLGFLHSVQYGKPSLVCDFIEIYRYLIDDFLVEYCRTLNSKHFIVKTENLGRKKKGKREYLNNILTRDLIKKLEKWFLSSLDIPRIRVGKKQTLETLVNEEALLFAKYLRNEKTKWVPRIVDNNIYS